MLTLLPAKEQTTELDRIAMIVEVEGRVLSEECVEGVFVECMRMGSASAEDHDIGDIDNTNATFRDKFEEESGSSDKFESDSNTNTDQDTPDIGMSDDHLN